MNTEIVGGMLQQQAFLRKNIFKKDLGFKRQRYFLSDVEKQTNICCWSDVRLHSYRQNLHKR